jgi:hypothetical protein
VDPARFELATFSMPLRRAPNCAMGPFPVFRLLVTSIQSTRTVTEYCLLNTGHCPGGPEGIRTPGLLSAIEARSQLRYRPRLWATGILPEAWMDVKHHAKEFVRTIGTSIIRGSLMPDTTPQPIYRITDLAEPERPARAAGAARSAGALDRGTARHPCARWRMGRERCSSRTTSPLRIWRIIRNAPRTVRRIEKPAWYR